MKKLFLTFVACIVAMVCFNTAYAQLYVTGIGGTWSMPPTQKVEADANGNYVFKTSTEFKMSKAENPSNWDAFNAGALVPATALTKTQTQTVDLKVDGGPNFTLPYGNGGVEFTISVNSDFSKVTVTGASAPVAGEYTILYLVGTNSGWGFNNDWKFQTEDGNLYYMENKTLANASEFKVAGNGWSPNYGDGGAMTINTEVNLTAGSNPANCSLATGGSNLTISFNMTTGAFLISNEGKKVGDSTEQNPYADVWVNCRGDFNDWQDNGVHPNSEGIATFPSLAIGKSDFEIKYYKTEDIYYGTDVPVALGQWTQLSEGGQHMTIANAPANGVYKVQFNVTNNKIFIEKVSGDDNPDVPTPDTAIYLTGGFSNWEFGDDYEFKAEGNGVYKLTLDELSGQFKVASSDWTTVNLGADSDLDSSTPVNAAIGENTLYQGSNANLVAGNGWKNVVLTLNYTIGSQTAVLTIETDVVIETPKEFYILGDIENVGWTPEKAKKMDGSNGDFSLKGIVVTEAWEGNGYFSFCTQQGVAGDWESLGIRYGAASADEPIAAGESAKLAITGENFSFMIAAGTYDIAVSFDEEGNGTVTVYENGGLTGVEAIATENGEAEYFNLQGVKVQNPDRGIFIKVANGKAVKVVK